MLPTHTLSAVLWALLSFASLPAKPATPPIPAGLWRSTSDGFVLRIEACGDGFCGVIAAPPASGRATRQDGPVLPQWELTTALAASRRWMLRDVRA